jgi:lipoate-protein ligase A
VGSAQWRDDGALLQHGSILVDDDQAAIPALMTAPAAAASRPATLRDVLGRTPEPDQVHDALADAVRVLTGGTPVPLDIDAATLADAARFAARYRDPHWTWRR